MAVGCPWIRVRFHGGMGKVKDGTIITRQEWNLVTATGGRELGWMNTMRMRLGRGRRKGKLRMVVSIAGTPGIMLGSVRTHLKEKGRVRI